MTLSMTREPSDAQVISEAITNRLQEINTCIPGVVLNYYTETQTIDVQVCNKIIYESYLIDDIVSEELPVLPNVPVCFPSGGGIHVTFPLVAGDNVIVLFSQSDINNFRSNNTPNNEPGLLGRFTLSGSMAIPTRVSNKTYTPTYVDSDSIVISKGGLAAFAARADLLEIELNKIKNATHTHNYSWTGSPGSSITGSADINYTPASVACTTLKIE